MRTFITSSQDTTIYERYPSTNAGLDEILEIGKLVKSLDGDFMYASSSARILINFDVPSEHQYPTNSRYYLNLRIANAKNVKRYQKLEVYPVSRSWIEGSGYFYQDVKNAEDGATWREASETQNWTVSGSDFVTTPSASYIVSATPIEDIKIDVTDILAPIVTASNVLPWNGLIIKYPTEDELDASNKGNIKVFSGNTHTIFSPKLEVVWNNQSFTTGSLKSIPGSNVSIIPKNIKETYLKGEQDKIYLVVRDKFPDKRFDAVQRYKTMYYLPSESYFRIKDEVSNVVIYDFDQYSAINCDTSGSFFILDTSALETNRYYNIDIKVKTADRVFFPSFNYSFKIEDNA